LKARKAERLLVREGRPDRGRPTGLSDRRSRGRAARGRTAALG
jgi:hypothetical protein